MEQMEELQPVQLLDMLDARERRAFKQKELIDKFHAPLVCFTMNIAGPYKNSPLIRRGFQMGCKELEMSLYREKIKILHKEEYAAATGNEVFYALDAKVIKIKEVTSEIEDSSPMARLFDMDVLDITGEKLDRSLLSLPTRKCLICGKAAKECSRSRTHTVEDLQKRTKELLEWQIKEEDSLTIAKQATRALLYEVTTTPKPGLVDRRNTGSHKDMDSFTFMSSAATLFPYFEKCARRGIEDARRGLSSKESFAAIRPLGKQAENLMLAATKGVNTHKGAIFSVGLACTALGRLNYKERKDPGKVLDECAKMTEGLTKNDYSNIKEPLTAGQRFYKEYGVLGVRGQAEAGFPAVLKAGLPVLEKGLELGLDNDRIGAAALLAMLCADDDTNMISRGGRQEQLRTTKKVEELLKGNPFPDKETLMHLDDQFIEKNLSPGGSADLLALSWLLHFFKTEEF